MEFVNEHLQRILYLYCSIKEEATESILLKSQIRELEKTIRVLQDEKIVYDSENKKLKETIEVYEKNPSINSNNRYEGR